MPDPSITVRRAVASDAPLILSFVKELATYEREPHAVVAKASDFLRDGFGEHPLFHVLIVEVPSGGAIEPAGFALYFLQYSTWEGRPALYLEDLFVRPEFRGLGLGRVLLEHLAREALSHACTRFQWEVLDWNVDAIGFYERLGARILHEWKNVRIEGEALRALAGKVDP
ncbi:GNAT family N-acetyltransferase [Pendulispora albinea]|uniref:GNAT family N-acetyltransferase n=1 Tax=Pendulispora albinea TaxID=2741071 RepID=A0ABZ2LNM3_9BACT